MTSWNSSCGKNLEYEVVLNMAAANQTQGGNAIHDQSGTFAPAIFSKVFWVAKKVNTRLTKIFMAIFAFDEGTIVLVPGTITMLPPNIPD